MFKLKYALIPVAVVQFVDYRCKPPISSREVFVFGIRVAYWTTL